MGVMVPIICTKSNRRVARINRFVIKPIPMAHSHKARIGTLALAGMIPNVNTSIVRAAKLRAGLRPGKNFSTPNQKKTTPKLTRRSAIP